MVVDGLFNQLTFGLDAKLNSHWTLGPEVSYWKITGGSGSKSDAQNLKTDAWRYILRGNWFYSGTFEDGFYIAPMLGVTTSSVTGKWTDNTSFGVSKVATFGAIMVGYAAFGDSFGANVGVGCATEFSGKYAEIQFHDGGWARSKPPNAIGFIFEYAFSWRY
jgi:hypothetical protein